MLDADLALRCQTLATAVTQALAWVDDNQELVKNEASGLSAELRRAGRLFRQCEMASQRKMCAGVFGPSQAGKSYLISALARDASGALWADFAGTSHDFISEINPEGGKESTGLVTRFTMTKPKALPEGFPVQIKLLSEMDLVKIIANTYYADCEHKAVPNTKAIQDSLDAVAQGAGMQFATATGQGLDLGGNQVNSTVNLDDWEDLQDYLLKDFKAKPRVQELERSYFPRAMILGPKLNLAGRIKLYSLIWDEVDEFTKLLEILLQSLQALGHAKEVFCALSALIPREGSIIDVAMLQGLGQQQNEISLEIVTPTGLKIALARSVVAALTAELTIVMQNKPDDYFDHTDLLDFPGYRSRYKIEDIRAELHKSGMLKEMFLRGKVAYLFQRYCAERELTSMLLCIGPSNQEVQDLPGVINDWVLATHGETPERRKGKAKALYFVLTKFDMEFEQKKGAPSVETRWDNRLHASLLDFFGKQHAWPKFWDNDTSFNNLFLLRNPNFRFDAILEYDAKGQEKGIRLDQQNYVSSLQAAFLQSSLVLKHFEHPAKAWEAAMLFNDGGISYIRQQLRPLCNPEIKQQQILTALEERQERLLSRLNQFWKTDNKEEERKQKELLSRTLMQKFAHVVQEQLFGEFLQALGLRDHELYDLYYAAEREMRRSMSLGQAESTALGQLAGQTGQGVDNNWRAADAQASGLAQANKAIKSYGVGSSIQAKDLLEDLLGEPILPIAEESEENVSVTVKSFKDEAEYFTDLIEAHWLKKLHTLAENIVMQQYFNLSARQLSDFIAELGLGTRRLNLWSNLEDELRKASRYANIDMDRIIWKQVSLAANMVNSYINWLGLNSRILTSSERTIPFMGKLMVVFEPAQAVGDYPVLSEEQGAYDKAYYADWLRALDFLIMANVDFDGQQTINVAENSRLGKILQVIKG